MSGAGPDIRGIIATCLTPFDPDGGVNYLALQREIDYIVDVCQADAIASAATKDAEYTMLGWVQRKELMRTGAEMVADVAQVLMPNRLRGGDPEPDEIYDYVAEIARRSPLPVSVYHNRATGADLASRSFLCLADVFNVPCFVETAGDVRYCVAQPQPA